MTWSMITSVFLSCAAGIALALWRRSRRVTANDALLREKKVLSIWPPEAECVLPWPDRLAYSTLRLALPHCLILAQVPVGRILWVPRSRVYAEWRRQVAPHCIDLVVCDIGSRVIAAIEIANANASPGSEAQQRQARIAMAFKAAEIPLYVWQGDRFPSVDAVRDLLAPVAGKRPIPPASVPTPRPAVPGGGTRGHARSSKTPGKGGPSAPVAQPPVLTRRMSVRI